MPNKIEVIIVGERDDENGEVQLVFKDLNNIQVDLTDTSIDDVKVLFNQFFDYVIDKKLLISFELNDAKNDLFHDVSKDIVDQLNAEVTESKDNFEKIWQLTPEPDTPRDQEKVE